ncbi:hypothetical protein [Paenibacillus sp. NPDC058071]|uniref:hypothetical protein n=1 Tax=Paenibacillus sp. NPDC058071 TaxID=3346326 RepID=UPI0036DCB2A2
MEEEKKINELREAVEKLFRDAGYEVPELLPTLQFLTRENERLKRENQKMRRLSARVPASADSMNSRLKDALRE